MSTLSDTLLDLEARVARLESRGTVPPGTRADVAEMMMDANQDRIEMEDRILARIAQSDGCRIEGELAGISELSRVEGRLLARIDAWGAVLEYAALRGWRSRKESQESMAGKERYDAALRELGRNGEENPCPA